MMPRRDLTPQDGSQPGVLRRKSRAGSTVLSTIAGLAVLSVGAVAMALAGVHSTPAYASSVCQTLPTGGSSPPPGSTPTVNASSISGGNAASSSAPTQLCVTVQATASTVQPGQPAQYKIDVKPTGGTVDDVTVQISASPSSFPAPAFNVCSPGDGTQTCKLGTLGANAEVQAQDAVPGSASSGSSVTLTATVTGVASGSTTLGSVSGIASVKVVAPPPTSTAPTSPPPSHHHGHGHHGGHSGHHSGSSGSNSNSSSNSNSNSGLGTSLGPSTVQTDKLAPLFGIGSTGSGANPGNLFPTISPSPGASGSGTGGSPGARSSSRGPYHPTSVADVLPLNPRQMGGQVAGLIVLALGVIIAVVRVSLRKPRTQGKQ